MPFHEAFFVTLGMVYCSCEFVIGFTTFTFLFTLAQIMKNLAENDWNKENGYDNIRQIYLVIHVFGWLSQFVGHGVYESKLFIFFLCFIFPIFSIERAPALFTNIMFMWIAPFFMVFEVMHMITGYKDDELKEAKWQIEADIAHYRLEKGYPMRPGIKLAGKD